MDTRLLEILEEEVQKEKSLMYYSGWHKDDKPVNKEEKSEKQTKLVK